MVWGATKFIQGECSQRCKCLEIYTIFLDFNDTFVPVARMETIRTILTFGVQLKLNIYQFDVKSAFLTGNLKEEVYIQQPEGMNERNRGKGKK